MNIQRLRNLTTRRLHTCMDDIYEDIEYITGEKGLMTHHIPNALRALEPYLRTTASDARLWNGEHDPEHSGDIKISPMNELEQDDFWQHFHSFE